MDYNEINRYLELPPRVVLKLKWCFLKRGFGHFGKGSWLIKPLKIYGSKNIYIGENVKIGAYSYLASLPLTCESSRLIIEDGVYIGDFSHIFSTSSIKIEKNALLANFVYISDSQHNFYNVNEPIKDQSIKQLQPIVIGSGCWIGEHVSIIGASIGNNSIIGANSVVTHDIPDYSVAVGAPAKVIKKFNFKTNNWERT